MQVFGWDLCILVYLLSPPLKGRPELNSTLYPFDTNTPSSTLGVAEGKGAPLGPDDERWPARGHRQVWY